MQLQKLILSIAFLGIGQTYAQDSTSRVLQLKEQTSPVTAIADQFFNSPALRPYQRNFGFSHLSATYTNDQQDLYLQQKGNGQKGYQVNSETYIKQSPTLTLWGKAYYINEKIKGVNFNESSDFDIVYPYVMTDTVGGDLNSESYFFKGGLAKKTGRNNFGFEASYRGVQAFRDVDPRPLNITSDIHVNFSASREISTKYALALALKGQKYTQNNELDFVSELGSPLVYHDAGLGAYNRLLAGERKKAYYSANSYAAAFSLAPITQKGFFAEIAFKQFSLDKQLDRIASPISEADERTYEGSIGYLNKENDHHFVVKINASTSQRKGLEAKFNNNDVESSVQRINNNVRFLNDNLTLKLHTVYGKTAGTFNWYIGGDAQFTTNNQQYVDPARYLDYSSLLVGLNLTGVKHLKNSVFSARVQVYKTEMLESNYYWDDANPKTAIFSMLNSNFAYLSASSMTYGVHLKADFPVSEKLACFIQAEGCYQTTINRKYFGITAGFSF
ncbi:DUF6850 family outer membrane beta-barrel protein [Pedobacter sp.]|uniref:DUF6850 family outer membrane beta-barrel protein n=1 Tax=Pedobacter sp. TaxID=1411316 RepID=UPI003D7F6E47